MVLLVVCTPEESFLVVFDILGQFQFKLSFCFSNCISARPGNALVVLGGYSSAFPHLVCLSFGFEQTQKLTVKPRRSPAPLTSLTLKGETTCCQVVYVGDNIKITVT